jgi:signal transduction histidine kinase
MEFNFLTNIPGCYVDVPNLLYYSHIPTAIVIVFIGLFLFFKNNGNKLSGRLFLFISLVFLIWILSDLTLWLTYNSTVMMFLWSFFGVLYILMHIFVLYFIYSVFDKKDISNFIKYIFLLLLVPISYLTVTKFNLLAFDATNCQPIEGHYFIGLQYSLGILLIIWLLSLVYVRFKKTSGENKKQILSVGLGALLFLITFSWSEIIGSLTEDFVITQYGLFGAPIFAAFIIYSIVRFKTFDIKLIGAQVLTWALVILIGSQFFFIKVTINYYLTSITFLGVIVAGSMIVRNVKREIAQKEEMEKLAKSLEIAANKLEASNLSLQVANEKLKELDSMKSEFVSLATHQIRGPLAAIKGYVSMMTEGDYGEVPPTIKEPLAVVFKSTDSLSQMVTDFLDVSRIDLGQMKYDFSEFDFRDLVQEVTKEFQPSIVSKGLEFKVDIKDQICPVRADRVKMKQVLNNIIDNAGKYTKQGFIHVSLERINDKVLFAVKDTGVGIGPKTMPLLFQRFSRAKNANETNILGTGLGLYVAKKMVEANNGRIWAQSEGDGKGSQFYVEISCI